MRNRIMTGLAAAAMLFMAAPLWAHDGHWEGRGHGHGHGHGHYKHGYYQPYTVVRERWIPAPVYAAPVYAAPVYAAPVYPAPVYRAPAPGVHIVLPNLFIPLR